MIDGLVRVAVVAVDEQMLADELGFAVRVDVNDRQGK